MVMSNTKSHPLEPIVRKAFKDNDYHDVSSLFPYFAGCTNVQGGNKAYCTVIRDVCGYMESQNKLYYKNGLWALL
jgi:hypothetical protein